MTITASEIVALLQEKNWVFQTNPQGMWVVGPEDSNGIISVCGMGKSLKDAIEMARRSQP